ncbi:hypothetical protein HIM_04710 [Hirsutella minnesotensis 3608]|uniref:Uncharacterized protein n=1 Tax=Hirsutella minnesotensis 3608 TaxID=1043627 RepID=A0A0F7ZL17_9HYPO|nr:hypothetical protein HIM_04710 [Hirsutella minnesotensis 3608]
MKPSTLLVGLGLAGAGLSAPVATFQVITTEDGIPLTRTEVARLDTAFADATSSSSELSTAERLSQYASAALEHLRLLDVKFEATPVFAVNKDRAEVMTDADGDLVVVSHGQNVRAVIWNPSTSTFYLYPMPGLNGRLPVAILAVSLWMVLTCLYLGRSSKHQGDGLRLDLSAVDGQRAFYNKKTRFSDKPEEKLPIIKEKDGMIYL